MFLRNIWLVHALVKSRYAIVCKDVFVFKWQQLVIQEENLKYEVKSCRQIKVKPKLLKDLKFSLLEHLNWVLKAEFLMTKCYTLLEIQDATLMHLYR